MTVRSRIEAFAPAKINLFLHVGDTRADGYHELESIAAFVDIGDKLIFERADTLSLTIEGPFAQGLAAESDNLVLRAARALAEYAEHDNPGAKITLIKNLPVASGIGGGSADAAAALRGLVRLWDLVDMGPNKARDVAETLGSDVPVCVESRTAWMHGRGEIVTFARRLPPMLIVLVNPRVAVPTGPVFAALKTRSGVGMQQDRIPYDPNVWGVTDYLAATANDLEAPALAIAPVIGEALAALRAQPDAMLARMSGSGATCFGFYKDDEAARFAADAIAAAHPGWWVQTARVMN
ncbi:MAG TPA: 4-(cytidine 5'-diphospho)-2-C-methyl-D-erythritol kinase [Rhizomicrobium sp.]|jgi:4-diphosphocytidyl-2-C-methyl-D-erythritol kinase|nr:4-(cytidine 5'-diphospho)-2-C-methyl-D-erythritol kinase [Rhizomicrobium sp.]